MGKFLFRKKIIFFMFYFFFFGFLFFFSRLFYGNFIAGVSVLLISSSALMAYMRERAESPLRLRIVA